jgi:hypothetical protein
MPDETPVLDTLADITAASVEHNSLPPRDLMLVRLAALIAVDAQPASYLANAEAAADSALTADDIQAVMIGVAPRWWAPPGWPRQAARSCGPWAWRSLWPTPSWPATATPGNSSNQAHHDGASRRPTRRGPGRCCWSCWA